MPGRTIRWRSPAAPDVDLVVEAMGGEDGPAKATAEAALAGGKHLVTANKALLARHGQALAELAEAAGVALRFEAAVAGGIPVVKALTEGLAGQRDHPGDGGDERHLQLHPDADGGRGRALRAGARGGASASATPRPTRASTSAGSTRRRSSRSSSRRPSARGSTIDAITVEGIERVSLADIEHAAELGYRIKLLGVARPDADGGLEARMQPCLVPAGSPIGQLEGVTNMVVLEGDFVRPDRDVRARARARGRPPRRSSATSSTWRAASSSRRSAGRRRRSRRRSGRRRARRRPTTCASSSPTRRACSPRWRRPSATPASRSTACGRSSTRAPRRRS